MMSITQSAGEDFPPMPAWEVAQWFNTPHALQVEDLRGKVVMLHAFQMLCPACVLHSIPQAQRVRKAFPLAEVAVVGLHTVFEHHDAMRPQALDAFIHEFRLTFPVGVDKPADIGPLPRTMSKLDLQGTPSILLLDRQGRIRLQHFGKIDDLELGALLGQLMAQA